MRKKLIVITGPTASGKTLLSIRIAKHFQTEIISADARQFYREMNIGTAKPAIEQLSEVPHHFINHLSIHDDYSAGKFESEAITLLENLFSHQEVIVMTGGSGLFIKAVLEGFDPIPHFDESVRKKISEIYMKEGIGSLQNLLREHDPEYYRKVDLNNPRRLIRALAVCLSTGKPFSSFQKTEPRQRNFIPLIIGLQVDRKELNERINRRADEMMENGLLQEAEKLFPFRDRPALQTVGYSELFDYIKNKISLEQAVNLIKQHTSNYAKRQMTWFRKMKNIHWFEPEKISEIILFIERKFTSEEFGHRD